MIVKVCGLNDAKNCLAIDKLKPDLVGMIFYKKSPRYIGETVLTKTKTKKVGVFVNATLGEILSAVEKHKLSYVQLHGNEPIVLAKALQENGIKIIKYFGIDNTIDNEKMTEWERYSTYFVFDTKGKQFGGIGAKFDWDLLNDYQLNTPFLLAGGITLEDVAAVKKINHPAFVGVDINSKFELEPGIKNIEHVKQFIDAIKK
ncbi:MAG: phosphoribosylanthranilate isomerase [Flavobacteriales bacterium]